MAANDKSANEVTGHTIVGRYRIISRLAKGGMGTAYRAWDEQAGIPVVIKIPNRDSFDDVKFAERFYREISFLKGLTHPHIVPILDVGVHDHLPFVVMKFLPGGSLSNRRLRDADGTPRQNPPGMLWLWLPAVAEALDFMHSHNVVHRDVKPANIFFDAFWGAYLGDFGIAKVIEESDAFNKENTLTANNMGVGTHPYMAPEQFTPKALIDGRTDQYALAVMAYEMLAGRRPFIGATNNLIVEVMTLPAPSLFEARSDLPVSLVDAVHRALSKKAEERFCTCKAFVEATLQEIKAFDDQCTVARLLCPRCASILKLTSGAGGLKGRCPKCKARMKVADDLGALWLLDEDPRQKKASAAESQYDVIEEEFAGVVVDEQESLDNFKVQAGSTLSRKSYVPFSRRAESLWKGVAALSAIPLLFLLIGIFFSRSGPSELAVMAVPVVTFPLLTAALFLCFQVPRHDAAWTLLLAAAAWPFLVMMLMNSGLIGMPILRFLIGERAAGVAAVCFSFTFLALWPGLLLAAWARALKLL